MQTEHLGWHTDDFLVVGEKPLGAAAETCRSGEDRLSPSVRLIGSAQRGDTGFLARL